MRLTLDLASRSAQLYRDGHWCPPELAEPYVQLFSQMTALTLPEPQASAPPVCLRKGSSLEQRRAVQTALTAPLSYVTAAAGCGKTGFVLASSLVSLLMAGRKVLLTAPTNYALDSAMRTVLGALGEDARRFCPVRLGCAGEDFQQDYGWVARIPSPAAALVGVTLDKLAQMLASGFLYQPDHIFLDEAAYAPLIKVLPLLRFPQARLIMLVLGPRTEEVCAMVFGQVVDRGEYLLGILMRDQRDVPQKKGLRSMLTQTIDEYTRTTRRLPDPAHDQRVELLLTPSADGIIRITAPYGARFLIEELPNEEETPSKPPLD